jgi:hypothetical protein
VLILVPAYLGIHWYDDGNNVLTFTPHRHITVVPPGTWATLGHNQWRMLGRQDGSPASTTSDGVELTLLLRVKVLDAKGAKELNSVEYEIRDRSGRTWSADGAVDTQSVTTGDPPVGSTPIVRVIATVPRAELSSVVLDLHNDSFERPERTVLDVLRFAH